MKASLSKSILVCVAVSIAALTCGGSAPAGGGRVLIIQDERPQMDVLAQFFAEKDKLSVTIADQQSMPKDFSPYKAVILFVHKVIREPTERAVIDYTKAGGRLVCLHHSISSQKAKNKFYFKFLGIQLDKGTMAAGGYAWKATSWTLVNLNSEHYITNHNIDWNDQVMYTSSDQPSVARLYPCARLTKDSEVYINHKFTDGRDKTVLCGLIYTDQTTGKTYMQDRAGWIKRQGKGIIVYLMPGHCVSDYQNPRIAQMILNAVTWNQTPQTP
jgi:Trehalose utilisation